MSPINKKKIKGFTTPLQVLKKSDITNSAKYVTKEYQDYGYRLALQLNDLKHKALYIKIAKNEKRILVEKALRFAKDYPKAKNLARIFMWKLKELKTDKD